MCAYLLFFNVNELETDDNVQHSVQYSEYGWMVA